VHCASLQGLKHVQVGPRNLWSVFFLQNIYDII
jgi:hypothetical protein